MKFAQTVLGKINVEEMGITLYHEHLGMKPGPEEKFLPYTFDDPKKIANELTLFKNSGGGTFVEMSPLNFGRDVKSYAEISEKTGVHVLCCTGFHKKRFIPDWVYEKKDSEIRSVLLEEINKGIDRTGIKAGVVKIGTSNKQIYPIEERIIAIVSSVNKETNIPVSTHCDKGTMVLEQCDLFMKNNIKPERVLLGHTDIPNDVDTLKKICDMGFNVGIDHVGRDLENHDQTKIDMIRDLIDGGYIEQLFIAGDMGKKDYLKTYGGKPGFDYIVTAFKDYLFENGIDESQYQKILIENTKRFFQTG